MSEQNIFEMSDEEFGALPPRIGAAVDVEDTDADAENGTENEDGETAGDGDIEAAKESENEASEDSVDGAEEEDEGAESPEEKADETATEDETPEEDGDDDEKVDVDAAEAAKHKELWDLIMTPFKAAGKQFQVNTPAEALMLMQKGVKFTEKMTALKPGLKVLRMLEKNGLMNEDKVSFLIDLNSKNPAAIQKFMRDNSIDPMEIDTEAEPAYQGGQHKIPDAELALTETLRDVMSDDNGKHLVKKIENSWDVASKNAVAQDPKILRQLHQQQENGIFEQVSNEIERRQALGQLDGVPFLRAYHDVGKELQRQGQLKNAANPNPRTVTTEPTEQGRRVVGRSNPGKQQSKTSLQSAKAAGINRTIAAQHNRDTQQDTNPFEMSDEEFSKQFKKMKNRRA